MLVFLKVNTPKDHEVSSEQWAVNSEQWAVSSEQWAVSSEQWAYVVIHYLK